MLAYSVASVHVIYILLYFQAMQSDTDSDNTVITDDDDEESVTNTSQEEKYNKVCIA